MDKIIEILKEDSRATAKDISVMLGISEQEVVEKIKNRRWNGAGQYKPIAGGDPKNPLGPRWLGFSSNIGTGYGAHGTSDEWSIGKNASMGCVRLLNDDIKELYEMVPTGIPVWIGHTETLEKWGLYKVSK